MRLLVSVRCESASTPVEESSQIAELVASIAEKAAREDHVYLVFDAAVGELIEVIRRATPSLPPQRTRVWGGAGEASGSVLSHCEVRSLRLRRCIAELEPDVIVDLSVGAPTRGAAVLLPVLPEVLTVRIERINGVMLAVHAGSDECVERVLECLGSEFDSVPIAHRAFIPQVTESTEHGAPQLEDGIMLADGEVVGQAPSPRRTLDIELLREGGFHSLEPGVDLDGTVARLLKERGHVSTQQDVIPALSKDLSLGTTLQLAHASGGYKLLRCALMGKALPTALIESWLSSVSRGGRLVAEDDQWRETRCALDAALSRSLGREVGAPEISAALQSDILPAVAGPRRLLVDISALVKFDAKSGIQRVVRNILSHLEGLLPELYQIVPIAFMDDGRCLHASRFYARFVGLPYDVPDDVPFVPRPGDVFLGLDLSAHIVPIHRSKFEWMRRLGIPIHFVVYDLLPMRRPECFDPRVVDLFRAWYASVADLADGVLCISRAVADEFADWLDEYRPRRIGALDIGYFHLGADIVDAAHQATETPHPVDGRHYALMVSTLEPRKGYAQALAAFEVLWARGCDLSLVIVGKQGWMMEALVERLRGHAELGRRLHWFEGIEDEMLSSLYRHADVLLSASEGEGFGLPLIEAAQYGVPVLCRDLPVFREIAGDAATYFRGYEPHALADAIGKWLETKEARPSPQIAWKTWREATLEFVSTLTAEQPYRRWVGINENHLVFSGYNSRLHTLVGERSHGDIVTTGREGVLIYGPYVALSAGTYRLLVHGDMPDGQAEAMQLEIVALQASFQVAAWYVKESKCGLLASEEFCLATDLDGLEVRLMVSSKNIVRVSKIEIIRDRRRSGTISNIKNADETEERVQ